jgi:hypothetical protein
VVPANKNGLADIFRLAQDILFDPVVSVVRVIGFERQIEGRNRR